MNLDAVCAGLRSASERLALCTADQKNRCLVAVAAALDSERKAILSANALDVAAARSAGMKESLIARLSLSDEGIDEIIEALHNLAEQTDPIGQVVSGWTVPNGLEIRQVRVPLGVAAVIYESRPNVTVDAFALAYKSSNAVLLRGSSSALQSNRVIIRAIQEGLRVSGGEADAVALCEPMEGPDGDRYADVDWILNAVGKIDVALPRGGSALIKRVVEQARIPVIETGSGVCHIYVDESADIEKTIPIVVNSKIQKPAACNSVECLLIHESRVREVLPRLLEAFAPYSAKTGRAGGVELRCDPASLALASPAVNAVPSSGDDWGMEYLDYIMAVRVVSSLEQAIEHINRYNTKHSETIMTENRSAARVFQQRVDAACVYVNASIRFTDGAQFGLGAEIGISTQKLHARGPMGLTALTTIKYLIEGEGQVRP